MSVQLAVYSAPDTLFGTMQVAILGASADSNRYAYRAAQRLKAAGHEVFGVNPQLPKLEEVQVVSNIAELPPTIHTLTMYVGAPKSSLLSDAISGYGFKRVIFNPGAENKQLAQRLRQQGVEVIEACTLVMLSMNQF